MAIDRTSPNQFIQEIADIKKQLRELKSGVGQVQTYFLGKLNINLTGVTLTAANHTLFIEVRLWHRFSKKYPDFQLLQNWYGQEVAQTGNAVISGNTAEFTYQRVFPRISTSPPTTQSEGFTAPTPQYQSGMLVFDKGVTDPFDPTNPNTEFMYWNYKVVRSGSNVTIPSQTLILIPHLYFLNQPLQVLSSPTFAQGGGGGVIYQRFDFYL